MWYSFPKSFFLIGSLFFYYYTGSILLSDIHILTLNIEYLFFNNNYNFLKILVYKYEYHEYFIKFFYFKHWFFEYLLVNNYIIKCDKPLFELGVLLICFSVCIKLSLAPFHFWSLDIYESSVSLITFFFMILTKLSYFIILFRVYSFLINKSNLIVRLFLSASGT